jgi:hypothetical protein
LPRGSLAQLPRLARLRTQACPRAARPGVAQGAAPPALPCCRQGHALGWQSRCAPRLRCAAGNPSSHSAGTACRCRWGGFCLFCNVKKVWVCGTTRHCAHRNDVPTINTRSIRAAQSGRSRWLGHGQKSMQDDCCLDK